MPTSACHHVCLLQIRTPYAMKKAGHHYRTTTIGCRALDKDSNLHEMAFTKGASAQWLACLGLV